MTFQEQIKTSGISDTIEGLVEELGESCWNAAVLACEDAANNSYDDALFDGVAHEDAFDEAMEAVRGLRAE